MVSANVEGLPLGGENNVLGIKVQAWRQDPVVRRF